jgi:hypothetical protein
MHLHTIRNRSAEAKVTQTKKPRPQTGAKAFTFAVPPRFDDGTCSVILVLCAHGHTRHRLLSQVLRAED